MKRVFVGLILVAGASALRVPTATTFRGAAPPLSSAAAQPRLLPKLLAPTLALSLTLPASADWYASMMVELNKPMINLNPFSFNPVGLLIVGLYGAYLAYVGFRPATEAEQAYADEVRAGAAKAAEEAPAFLKAATDAEGAVVTSSGLVFLETTAGSGVSPSVDDTVSVHYEGKLCDGTVFDSSLARGEPTEFKVGQVIKGWQEGLQLMKVGGKATLTVPAELAYGPAPVGSIPGNSALQFEVELLEIKEEAKAFGFF